MRLLMLRRSRRFEELHRQSARLEDPDTAAWIIVTDLAYSHPVTSRQQRLIENTRPSIGERLLISGRELSPTPVFDTYWRFAARRQRLYFARLSAQPEPWTDDDILASYRFTNVYRGSDRVSQYLIRHVQYRKGLPEDPNEVFFRTMLFKFFNKIETWEEIENQLGPPSWSEFDYQALARVLDKAAEKGPIYSAAYVIPPPRLGERKKHRNHLRLLERMVRDRLGERIAEKDSLKDIFQLLSAYPSIGPFLAYQFTIDLNYSSMLGLNENDFVVAGPGARDGIQKCFGPGARGIEAEIIRWMVERQTDEFRRLNLTFPNLFGRQIHLIDAQNLFCEVDKYARVAHPNISGISGRTRIKQRFQPKRKLPDPFFPPSWNLRPFRHTASV